MSAATIIFPHQLFKTNLALKKGNKIFIIEEFLFFRKYTFHKQKLVLHRASMKTYEAYLQKHQFDVTYIECTDDKSDVRILIAALKKEKISHIHFAEVVDDWLAKRITSACQKSNIKFTTHQTPAFLNTKQEGDDFFATKKKYFQTDFYIHQRKKREILVDDMAQPIGGKWSFDADNRSKFPAKEIVPMINFPKENNFVKEAKEYVSKNFGKNYGNIDDFIYPINFEEAESWLQDFLKNRFEKFGVYEDAIVAKENFLNHSVLSPMINIGLLTPQQVVNAAISYATKNNISLNSVEGFIRQIIGWREFIKIVYEREGGKQRTTNYWGFDRKIPASFWNGTTGIEPIDNTIKKLLKTGYNHHIERLMLLGNFMLLCEFNPDETYKWFMEMYVDSYDWVMVPNVYGMVQFADGGLMTTKPYISGSNYVLKMSDYKASPFEGGKEGALSWGEIWDGLFWRFMHIHRSFFLKNPRLGMLVNMFDKMPEQKQKTHLHNAERFLESLDKAD
jgi:deoxyribodipyrimidine photolyase-related protein